MKNKYIKIIIDLKPALTEEQLDDRILRDFKEFKNKQFKHSLDKLLPQKMIPLIIELSGINENKRVNEVTKEERKTLIQLLKNFTITIKQFRPVEEAIITCGGINTKEINPKTMESKIIKGLYFAGEINRCRCYTGGFIPTNMHILLDILQEQVYQKSKRRSMEEFTTILNDEIAEIVEKKSRFIANIYHVENVEEAEEKIKSTKKKYYDAKHNCIAYRVIENGKVVEKASDDGEPSGTAGGPILNILQKNNLCNLVVIVTRYFGGILLGTGGLVRAYSDATQKAIAKSIKVQKIKGFEIKVELEYANFEIFKYYCKNKEINITKLEYSENIMANLEMEEKVKDIFLRDIETKTINIKNYKMGKMKYISKFVEKSK